MKWNEPDIRTHIVELKMNLVCKFINTESILTFIREFEWRGGFFCLFLFCFVWGHTQQCSGLLALQSGIASNDAQGTLWETGDWIWVNCMQDIQSSLLLFWGWNGILLVTVKFCLTWLNVWKVLSCIAVYIKEPFACLKKLGSLPEWDLPILLISEIFTAYSLEDYI